MRDLVAEYKAGARDLLELYASPPSELLNSAPAPSRWDTSLVEAVNSYQTKIGGSARIRGDEAVVITGQQPALFTGPLYTIYKAITTIRLAAAISERIEIRCAPVFWIGSEDHDFEEARSATILTKSHLPLTLRYDPQQDVEGLPMYRVPLDQSLHELIDEAAREAPGSEFRDEVAEVLHTTLHASRSLADWTARLLARLFRGTPLVFFEPHLDAARRLSAAVIEREIEAPIETTRVLNEEGLRLERLDFAPQLSKGTSECNFFLECDGRRRKVLFEKGRFVLPEENSVLTTETLRETLRTDPQRFSPNVALRCIVQQRLFSPCAYVAGPGEIAYWAQLKPVFRRYEMPMPVVYPRAECSLTTLKLTKIREKFGITVTDVLESADELLDRALRASSTDRAYVLLRERRPGLETMFRGLSTDLHSFDSSAASMADALWKDIEGRLDKIEKTVVQADAARIDATRKQLDRLTASLAPWRKRQERVYNVFGFLFEQGWELIPRLICELDIDSFQMNVVEL